MSIELMIECLCPECLRERAELERAAERLEEIRTERHEMLRNLERQNAYDDEEYYNEA